MSWGGGAGRASVDRGGSRSGVGGVAVGCLIAAWLRLGPGWSGAALCREGGRGASEWVALGT